MIVQTKCRRGWALISMGLLLVPYLTYLAKEPTASLPAGLPPAVSQKVDFIRDIQPIFTQTCYPCHGPAMQMSSFRLDQRESAMAGGNSGRVIKPGDSANSKLIQLVAGVLKDAVMPPEGERLSKEQVGLLRAWIDQGANWPEGSAASAAPATSVAKSNHWSFQPVKDPAPPGQLIASSSVLLLSVEQLESCYEPLFAGPRIGHGSPLLRGRPRNRASSGAGQRGLPRRAVRRPRRACASP